MESVVSVEALRAEAVASLHDELGYVAPPKIYPTVAFHQNRLYFFYIKALAFLDSNEANCKFWVFYCRRIRQSRKRKLQELYAVERHTKRLKPFPSSDIVARWGETGAVLDELEQKFLDENDIEKYAFLCRLLGYRCAAY
jgi:hypothetical protein